MQGREKKRHPEIPMQSIIQAHSFQSQSKTTRFDSKSENANLLRRRGSLFRHNNRQDPVLQTSANSILIDARGEAESALEVTDRPLLRPEVRLVVLGSVGNRIAGSSGVGGASSRRCVLVFDGGLVPACG